MKRPLTILTTLNLPYTISSRLQELVNVKHARDVVSPLDRVPLVGLVCVDKSREVDDPFDQDLKVDKPHCTDVCPSFKGNPLEQVTPRKFTISSSWINSIVSRLEVPAAVSVLS
jgi:hypothetical protein